MPQPSDAEDHLRIIRSLMEKATIYRAISAHAALIGGVLACVAGGLLAGSNDPFVKGLAGSRVHAVNAQVFGFQMKWFTVLVLSAAANFYFLYRDAERRGGGFLSPGMRPALRGGVPAPPWGAGPARPLAPTGLAAGGCLRLTGHAAGLAGDDPGAAVRRGRDEPLATQRSAADVDPLLRARAALDGALRAALANRARLGVSVDRAWVSHGGRAGAD